MINFLFNKIEWSSFNKVLFLLTNFLVLFIILITLFIILDKLIISYLY